MEEGEVLTSRFGFEQRPEHNHGILIRPIVLLYGTGNHSEFLEAEPFPQTPRPHIL
jgi:hypothetical protein